MSGMGLFVTKLGVGVRRLFANCFSYGWPTEED